MNLLASQIGAALLPLLVVPIQLRYGWRASFFVFGFAASCGLPKFPWKTALRSQSVRALLVTAFCYVYVFNFFQTWFHTFLVKGRGFTETGLIFSALRYVVAACANLSGGLASDRIGAKNGRRVLGVGALAAAGVFTTATMMTRQQALTVVFLALAYGAITFQQSVVFGVCLDAGAVIGLMNTSAQIGGFIGAVAFGYIVERFHSYDAPFVPMAGCCSSAPYVGSESMHPRR